MTVLIAMALAGCGRNAASYVAKGNKFFEQHRYDDALIQYRKAVQLDRKNGEAYYRMALVNIEQQQFPQAYEMLTLANEFSPRSRKASVALGELVWTIYTADDRPAPRLYNDLKKISDKLLAGNPSDFDGLRFKAEIAVADKRIDDAIAVFQQANALQPDFPGVVMPLAQLLAQKGDNAPAEQLLKGLVDKKPTYTPAYSSLSAMYKRDKRFADAEALLRKEVESNPTDVASYIQLAEHYSSQGNSSATETVLRTLSDKRSQVKGARVALADFYARHKQPDESVKQLEQAVKEDPKNQIDYWKRMALVFMSSGRRRDVERCLSEILKQDPKDFEARQLSASLLLASRKPDDIRAALAAYTDLVKIKPNDTDLRFNYAMALLNSGDAKAARAELITCMQQQPRAITPRLALAELGFRETRFSETIELTNEILARDSQQPLARLLHAMALSGLGSYGAAREELTRLVHEEPGNPGPELELGMLDIMQKRYADASAIFSKYYRSNQTDPRNRGIEGIVRTDVAQGQVDKAVSLLADEVQKSPNSIPLRSLLATVALGAQKYDIAIAQYEALAARSPKSSDLQLRWADLLHQKGDVNGAIEHYRKAKELAPKNPMPAALLARELERAGQIDEAIATYRGVLQLDPNNLFALNNLAFLLADRGQDLDTAQQMAETARRMASDSTAVADTLGWIYLKEGHTSSALQVFERLVRADPKNATYHYHFGATLLATGNKTKARDELKTALGSKPSQLQEPKIRELLQKIG